MKQLLIFLFLVLLAFSVRLYPSFYPSRHNQTIHVYVKGEVVQEKKLSLPLYAKVEDAIKHIEIKSEGDMSAINPLLVLKDGDVIEIPKKPATNTVKVSINTGSVEELSSLKGIGEKVAQRIIAYRNENGLFQALEDIMNVKGIGPNLFAKIKDGITL